jgi:quercetin dioxygenase-like cupin family protein
LTNLRFRGTTSETEFNTDRRPAVLWFLNNLAVIHASSDDTDGKYGLVEITGAKGDMPPLHMHESDDEGFYVLDGRVRLHLADAEPVELEAGDYALAPRGIPHTYVVVSDQARWLATTSNGFDRFVAAVGVPADAPTLPPSPHIPSPDEMGALAADHGITILGPPGALPS